MRAPRGAGARGMRAGSCTPRGRIAASRRAQQYAHLETLAW
jgi:hypothetical protein